MIDNPWKFNRPLIYPSEGLEVKAMAAGWMPTYINPRVAALLDDAVPMPTTYLEQLKALAAAEYIPPFTAEEIKRALEPYRKFQCWDDLRGRAHGATGDLSSDEFVRNLRDDWV